MSTESIKVEKSFGVYVCDDEAEFVQVAGKHEHGVAIGIETSDPVSHGIRRVLIRGRLNIAVVNSLSFPFIPGGRTSVEKVG
jgi:hypothetical protein